MSGLIEAILNVLTIVALISATAFIIIFLIDLFMSITNRYGAIFFRAKNETEVKPKVEKAEVKPAEEDVRPKVLGKDDAQEQTWDEEAARRESQALEQQKLLAQNEEQELEAARQKDLEQIAADEANREQMANDFDDFDSLFADIQPKETEEQLNFDDMIDEINKESVTKYEANKKVEIVEPVKEQLEPVATKENEDFGVKFDDDELDDFDSLFANDAPKETIENAVVPVEKASEAVKVEPEIINVYEYFPIDALNERLEKLQERLKTNERDLKANRKEYNPLARVNRNLKRDQEKLRRREAVVARKKVMLYGVNNYVDIDEEKAKKLSEDLDLLDGLRLSVHHCEEVMEQNKDRFPILEKTNSILVEQNKQIKDDIAEVKAAIDKLNNDNQ